MGNFIDMASILAAPKVVQDYINATPSMKDGGIYSINEDRTLILFEKARGEFSRIQKLSEQLSVPAFALHIHDDDLWMYEFYVNGVLSDKFNPMPDYWDEITEEQMKAWKGDATVLANHWPGLNPADVERYLVYHGDPAFNGKEKAYPNDEYPAWDIWQVCDFLGKLGTPYPPNEDE